LAILVSLDLVIMLLTLIIQLHSEPSSMSLFMASTVLLMTLQYFT
jgi:hypothetical protein